MEKRFTGFSIDIVQKLASPEYMNFNYTIEILNGTGGVNKNTSRWSGIIGELIDQVMIIALHVLSSLRDCQWFLN